MAPFIRFYHKMVIKSQIQKNIQFKDFNKRIADV